MTPAESRERLLEAIGSGPVQVVLPPGNTGDKLIAAGQEALLKGVRRHYEAETVLVGGSGGWCGPYHGMPARVRRLEDAGRNVIVLPSSYDVTEPTVAEFLEHTQARLFAREARSAADTGFPLAHCPSFFFDFARFERRGSGTLYAFRTDKETARRGTPRTNVDVSRRFPELGRWLLAIAGARTVHTDRAHVMIAAALMHKRVVAYPGSYFKVEALADTWLSEFDVTVKR